MVRWKSEAVVAWLELVVKMPMYSKACSDNVKSGKVSTLLTPPHFVPRVTLYILPTVHNTPPLAFQ